MSAHLDSQYKEAFFSPKKEDANVSTRFSRVLVTYRFHVGRCVFAEKIPAIDVFGWQTVQSIGFR